MLIFLFGYFGGNVFISMLLFGLIVVGMCYIGVFNIVIEGKFVVMVRNDKR